MFLLDFLTVYFRSPVDDSGFAKISARIEPLFREVEKKNSALFQTKTESAELYIKATDYCLAFWDGVNCHRRETKI